MCDFCQGNPYEREPIFFQSMHDCVYIGAGNMLEITAFDREAYSFPVKYCPMCGRKLGSEYLKLREGDDIYYADFEKNAVVHGKIRKITVKNEEIESFSVNFGDGDFEFDGSGLGKHCFIDQHEAAIVLENNEEDEEE